MFFRKRTRFEYVRVNRKSACLFIGCIIISMLFGMMPVMHYLIVEWR